MNKMGLLKLHITLQFVWTEGIFLNDKDSNRFYSEVTYIFSSKIIVTIKMIQDIVKFVSNSFSIPLQ